MNDYLFLIFLFFFFLLSETVDVLTASISFFPPFCFSLAHARTAQKHNDKSVSFHLRFETLDRKF